MPRLASDIRGKLTLRKLPLLPRLFDDISGFAHGMQVSRKQVNHAFQENIIREFLVIFSVGVAHPVHRGSRV